MDRNQFAAYARALGMTPRQLRRVLATRERGFFGAQRPPEDASPNASDQALFHGAIETLDLDAWPSAGGTPMLREHEGPGGVLREMLDHINGQST